MSAYGDDPMDCECGNSYEWDFCEKHQIGFCRDCELDCPSCRRARCVEPEFDDGSDGWEDRDEWNP